MSKSISAKFTSEVLELFSAYMEKNSERLIEESLHKGEKPSSPPVVPKTRIVDTEDGRVFYANEDGRSGITVFYLHGGAYYMDFARAHWIFMNKLIKEADVQLIAPAYRRLPFATWRDAFDFVVPLYREYCDSHPEQKIVLRPKLFDSDERFAGLSTGLCRVTDGWFAVSVTEETGTDTAADEEYPRLKALRERFAQRSRLASGLR